MLAAELFCAEFRSYLLLQHFIFEDECVILILQVGSLMFRTGITASILFEKHKLLLQTGRLKLQLVDLGLEKCLLLLMLFDARLSIAQGEAQLLRAEIFLIALQLDLGYFALKLRDHLFEHFLILLVLLKQIILSIQVSDPFVSLCKLDFEIAHLIDFLLIHVHHSLILLQRDQRLPALIQLSLESVDSLLVLPLHEGHLILDRADAFVFLSKLICIVALIGSNFLVLRLPLLIQSIIELIL